MRLWPQQGTACLWILGVLGPMVPCPGFLGQDVILVGHVVAAHGHGPIGHSGGSPWVAQGFQGPKASLGSEGPRCIPRVRAITVAHKHSTAQRQAGVTGRFFSLPVGGPEQRPEGLPGLRGPQACLALKPLGYLGYQSHLTPHPGCPGGPS